jgi:hypothetical protein
MHAVGNTAYVAWCKNYGLIFYSFGHFALLGPQVLLIFRTREANAVVGGGWVAISDK